METGAALLQGMAVNFDRGVTAEQFSTFWNIQMWQRLTNVFIQCVAKTNTLVQKLGPMQRQVVSTWKRMSTMRNV